MCIVRLARSYQILLEALSRAFDLEAYGILFRLATRWVQIYGGVVCCERGGKACDFVLCHELLDHGVHFLCT